MRSDFAHHRSTLHAFTAWLCVAMQLAVFSAAGWHFHAAPGQAVAQCCSDQTDHSGLSTSDDPKPHKAPKDGRDPDGCGLCKAILALGHATPPLPVVLVLALPQVPAEPPAQPQVRSLTARGPQCARGPPVLALVSFPSIL